MGLLGVLVVEGLLLLLLLLLLGVATKHGGTIVLLRHSKAHRKTLVCLRL
jgi:hypothetical protein